MKARGETFESEFLARRQHNKNEIICSDILPNANAPGDVPSVTDET